MAFSFGSKYVYKTFTQDNKQASCRMSDTTWVVGCKNSSFDRASWILRVATNNSGVISYGTEAALSQDDGYSEFVGYFFKLEKISDTKFLAVWNTYDSFEYNTKIYGVIGTISGTTITFGTQYGSTYSIICAQNSFDMSIRKIDTNKYIVLYPEFEGTGSEYCYIKFIVMDTSGSYPTQSDVQSYDSSNKYERAAIEIIDSSNFFLICKKSDGTVKTVLCSISGTTITFGTEQTTTAISDVLYSCPIDTNKWIIQSSTRKVFVLSLSSGTFSYGSEVDFCTLPLYIFDWWYYFSIKQLSTDVFIIAYRDTTSSSYGTVKVGTVTGTSLSFSSGVVFNSSATLYVDVCPLTNKIIAVNYGDYSNSTYGTSQIGIDNGEDLSIYADLTYTNNIDKDLSTSLEKIVDIRYATNIDRDINIELSLEADLTYTNKIEAEKSFVLQIIADLKYAWKLTGVLISTWAGKVNRAVSNIVQSIYSKSNILKEDNKSSGIVIKVENNSKINKDDNKKSIVQIEAHNNSRGN